METLYIESTNKIQAIQDAIHATSPGASIIFKSGDYLLDRTLQFVEGRAYISRGAVFQCTPEWEGPIMELVDRPDAEKSRLEKALSGRPILMKIVVWACRLLHIPLAPGTFMTGFILQGNGQNTGTQMSIPTE